MTKQELIGKYKNIRHFFESVWEVVKTGYPARKLTVIGVTGTDGKTTTSHLIYETLKAAGFKVALISTVAAYIGNEEIDTGFHVTTPDARLLQPLIKKIADAGMTHLVLEVTSHGLDQHRVLGCNFMIGVITNITHEHLDYHKTMENYTQTKLKLLKGVKYAVINDQIFPQSGIPLSGTNLKIQTNSNTQVVKFQKTKLKTISPVLAGEYNKENIAAAEEVAKIFGIQYSVFSKVIKEFKGVPGRIEEMKFGQKFRVIVDFAHTPNALERVLSELKKQKPKGKKLISVFGCAGLRDHTKRPLMGKAAMKLADIVIVTAEDPRTEKLEDIYKDIAATGSIREDDRQKAIEMAVKMAKPGDIVVVTGKGHEKSMCFGTTEYPWSDQETVKKAIMK